MKRETYSLGNITLKAVVVHTVTYFLVGLLAMTLFHYEDQFNEGILGELMRSIDDPVVAAGPLVQPLRGALFGLVFYLLREPVFNRRDGWLRAWATLVIVGIIAPFGPAPGSIEGLIYTTLPISTQLSGGMLEVLLQSLLLSTLLFYWVKHPQKTWLNWTLGIAFTLSLLLPILGLLAAGLT